MSSGILMLVVTDILNIKFGVPFGTHFKKFFLEHFPLNAYKRSAGQFIRGGGYVHNPSGNFDSTEYTIMISLLINLR